MLTIYDSTLTLVYCLALAAILGAVLGSFLNCAAWRYVHGGSALRGRSVCPSCGHVLGPGDLVPVASYLILRGKCRYCGTKISLRYMLAELAFALVTVLCLLRFDLTVLCLRNWVFLGCLFLLTLTDLEDCVIPDGSLIAAAAAWFLTLPLLWNGWGDAAARVLTGLVAGGALLGLSLLMDRILGKESLGGGDIKLFAVVGLYLGPVATLFAVLLSCILGLAFAAVARRGRGKPFPFGPAIAVSACIMLLWGAPLVSWYMGLF